MRPAPAKNGNCPKSETSRNFRQSDRNIPFQYQYRAVSKEMKAKASPLRPQKRRLGEPDFYALPGQISKKIGKRGVNLVIFTS
jgi:hypothetical protein